MAEKNSRDQGKTKAHEDHAATSSSKLATRLMIAGFVVAMASVQIVIAVIFIPFARSAEKADSVTSNPIAGPSIGYPGLLDASILVVEVDLGTYDVTSYQPSSEVAVRIDFQLWGIVTEKRMSEFTRAYQQRKNRLREQVQITVRSSDPDDLRDAGLGLIKRRLLSKINRTLGKPLLRGIIIPQISIVEI